MKNILIILLFISPLSIYANNWETVKYKDLFSLKLPPGYRDTVLTGDSTMSVKYYFGQEKNIVYSCSIIEEKNPGYINSIKKLEEKYNAFLGGYLSKFPKAEVLDKQFIDFKNLRALKVRHSATIQGQDLMYNLLTLEVKKTSISFETTTLQEQNNDSNFLSFLNSVNFNNKLTKNDQMNSLINVISSVDSYTLGHMIGKILPFLIIAVIGIIFILKRK